MRRMPTIPSSGQAPGPDPVGAVQTSSGGVAQHERCVSRCGESHERTRVFAYHVLVCAHRLAASGSAWQERTRNETHLQQNGVATSTRMFISSLPALEKLLTFRRVY